MQSVFIPKPCFLCLYKTDWFRSDWTVLLCYKPLPKDIDTCWCWLCIGSIRSHPLLFGQYYNSIILSDHWNNGFCALENKSAMKLGSMHQDVPHQDQWTLEKTKELSRSVEPKCSPSIDRPHTLWIHRGAGIALSQAKRIPKQCEHSLTFWQFFPWILALCLFATLSFRFLFSLFCHLEKEEYFDTASSTVKGQTNRIYSVDWCGISDSGWMNKSAIWWIVLSVCLWHRLASGSHDNKHAKCLVCEQKKFACKQDSANLSFPLSLHETILLLPLRLHDYIPSTWCVVLACSFVTSLN